MRLVIAEASVPFRIEETFQLGAPIERVWAYLTDPRQVVTCLPGAELTAVESETIFLGKVKVKVGPVVAAYSGKVTLTERDEATHTVRMTGEGRESTGSGSARMTMSSTLAALPAGGTEVRLTADLDVVGKLAQFGRGMIENVNRQMLRQFTDCARATLESVPATAEPPPPSDTLVAAAGAATATTATSAPPVVGTYAPPEAAVTTEAQPVRIVPVLLRAIWATIVGFFRRLFGRRS
jgi:carbon monoxide dehydrogenase subunit G